MLVFRNSDAYILFLSHYVHACSVGCVQLYNMDCSPQASVYGIFQAGILEWVAIPSFRDSSQPKYQTCISCTGRWILYYGASWEDLSHYI